MYAVEQSFLNAFNQTRNTILNFKNRLTDNEYMPILNQLNISKSQYENLVHIKKYGQCETCILTNNIYCLPGTLTFKKCKNINYMIEKCPILRNIIIINSMPQTCEYTYQMFYKTDINFSLNIQNNIDSPKICLKHFKCLSNLYTINKIYLSKIFLSVAIYSYVFKNFKVFIRYNKIMDTIYNKLIELNKISKTTKKKELLCINIMQQLYNVNTNIFKIFLQNIEPHYFYKQLLKQFNAKYGPDGIIIDGITPCLLNTSVLKNIITHAAEPKITPQCMPVPVWNNSNWNKIIWQTPDITSRKITTSSWNNSSWNKIVRHVVSGITNLEITAPGITNPEIIASGITNPEIIALDIKMPEIKALDITNPDIIALDIKNPEIIALDIKNPEIITLDIKNPEIKALENIRKRKNTMPDISNNNAPESLTHEIRNLRPKRNCTRYVH